MSELPEEDVTLSVVDTGLEEGELEGRAVGEIGVLVVDVFDCVGEVLVKYILIVNRFRMTINKFQQFLYIWFDFLHPPVYTGKTKVSKDFEGSDHFPYTF
jgi:hypothetical protein